MASRDHDRAQPARELGWLLQLTESLPGSNECLLSRFFGAKVIPQKRIGAAERHILVTSHQFTERVLTRRKGQTLVAGSGYQLHGFIHIGGALLPLMNKEPWTAQNYTAEPKFFP